ncbi:hypothetical protein Tco_1024612 [Tanacetum coccineum]
MSLDEASSGVTYTSISSDYKEPSDSGDDADDEDEEEASEEDEDVEEEEEHLPPANSTAAASPVVDLVPSTAKTEPFETDESAATPPPPPAYRTNCPGCLIRELRHLLPFHLRQRLTDSCDITSPPYLHYCLSSPLPSDS